MPIIVFGNEDASCGAVEAYVPAGPAWSDAAARVRMLEPKGTTLDRNRDFVELPLRRLARQAWVVTRSVGGRASLGQSSPPKHPVFSLGPVLDKLTPFRTLEHVRT